MRLAEYHLGLYAQEYVVSQRPPIKNIILFWEVRLLRIPADDEHHSHEQAALECELQVLEGRLGYSRNY